MESTLTIRRVSLDELELDPGNARTHDEKNLAAITDSLTRFGQAEPLVVQARTKRVVGGNGRLVAMRALGWRECDVVELELSDQEARAARKPAVWQLRRPISHSDAQTGILMLKRVTAGELP